MNHTTYRYGQHVTVVTMVTVMRVITECQEPTTDNWENTLLNLSSHSLELLPDLDRRLSHTSHVRWATVSWSFGRVVGSQEGRRSNRR